MSKATKAAILAFSWFTVMCLLLWVHIGFGLWFTGSSILTGVVWAAAKDLEQ